MGAGSVASKQAIEQASKQAREWMSKKWCTQESQSASKCIKQESQQASKPVINLLSKITGSHLPVAMVEDKKKTNSLRC